MDKASPSVSRIFNLVPTPYYQVRSIKPCRRPLISRFSRVKADYSQSLRKSLPKRTRNPPHLITISTNDGRWHGEWAYEYLVSLQELQLADLVEEGQKDAEVSIRLTIHKHTGFGLSVDGRIITSFVRKCSSCLSPYCRRIDTNFNAWILPLTRDKQALQLPEIGGDDPSVIYAKPGSEVDLDSLIQETLRLSISAKDTCSESCEESTPSWHCFGKNEAFVDVGWSRLLEMKNRI